MTDHPLSTDPYKGVRDFYPEDAAVIRYIFGSWSKTAESFGYARYDASILEPAELYRSKGAENEELVNDQTYTFTDRGDREVTLRPEMTPTVARLVAGRRRTLQFPLRWYSIPNLFRYERPQRGRLREHYQLNCDLFGVDDVAADIEIIALAYQLFIDLGATPDMFEIQLNDRREMQERYHNLGITDEDTITAITQINDRKQKMTTEAYHAALHECLGDSTLVEAVQAMVEDTADTNPVLDGLRELGITNAKIDRSIARGFNYYTGTIFEILDTHPENNRAMLGGGRYDNLTALFGGEAITGVGFGMGDVTMRDFLETNGLLPDSVHTTAPEIAIIPAEPSDYSAAAVLAGEIRTYGRRVAVDIGSKKLGKKIKDASDGGAHSVLVLGADERASSTYTLKRLSDGTTRSGTLPELFESEAEVS